MEKLGWPWASEIACISFSWLLTMDMMLLALWNYCLDVPSMTDCNLEFSSALYVGKVFHPNKRNGAGTLPIACPFRGHSLGQFLGSHFPSFRILCCPQHQSPHSSDLSFSVVFANSFSLKLTFSRMCCLILTVKPLSYYTTLTSLFQEKLRDGSVSKALDAEVWGPEFSN